MDYDPEIISYEQLLDIFWASHEPTRSPGSGQYMNAVFYHDDQQLELAMASKTALEQKLGSRVRTAVVPIRSFTMAEDYHQKFTLKTNELLKKELSSLYPLHLDFVNSTAAARLNGYLGGYGTAEQLALEIDLLGLSVEGRKALSRLIRK